MAYLARSFAPLVLVLLGPSLAAAQQAQQPERDAARPPHVTARPSAGNVAPAAAEETIVQEAIGPGVMMADEEYYPGRPLRRHFSRTYCGDASCGDCCLPSRCWYVRGEYLLWGTKGMNVPALVTTGDGTQTDPPAGVINEDGSLPGNTVVLFGNDDIHDGARSGGRIIFGTQIGPCRQLIAEGEYFALGDEDTNFRAASDGSEFLGIPYFDESANGLPAVFFVSQGGSTGTAGLIDVAASTRFEGAGARVIYTMCGSDGCGTSWWDGCPINTGSRVDLIAGYRFYRLDDVINIREEHLIGAVERVGFDLFDAKNEFHGFDVGTQMQFRRGCWSLDLLSKVAIGNTRSTVTIDGIAFQDGEQQEPRGSILAQSTNIGTHLNDEFTMVPEVGIGLGYQINPCWRLTAGYSLIYWCSVRRAGDQIDQHLNPELWPPRAAQPEQAGLWPQFPGVGSDFWAQGLNVGLEATW